MIYKAFQDLQLSQLGFGTMRLPLRENKSIDEELAAAMTDAAIRQGFAELKPASAYDALYESARCRSEAGCVFVGAGRRSGIRFTPRPPGRSAGFPARPRAFRA